MVFQRRRKKVVGGSVVRHRREASSSYTLFVQASDVLLLLRNMQVTKYLVAIYMCTHRQDYFVGSMNSETLMHKDKVDQDSVML